MEQDTEPTTVIFRKESGGDILAVFPYEIAEEHSGFCSCYAHFGQHSACDWGYVTQKTDPAKPSEYADLKAELESIGYVLDIRRRRNHDRWSKAWETLRKWEPK